MGRGFWKHRKKKEAKEAEESPGKKEKSQKPSKPHPLIQGPEFGWPSEGLKRRFKKNFIKDWG